MEWSAQQDDALMQAKRWLDDPAGEQVFRLFGYAGTGKSTLAHELFDHVNGNAVACAYTGKAASVMARKGLPGATTVHRLIYTPTGGNAEHLNQLKAELKLLEEVREPSRGLYMRMEAVRRAIQEAEALSKQPTFILKDYSEISRCSLVILDECSMVNERMAQDLLSFGVKVLVLGDPAQLPPVKGTGFFIEAQPDALLTEVHRQAKGNAIIEIATMIRNGRTPPLGQFNEVDVVRGIDAKRALAADQILCGTNAKRQAINARHRQLGGHDHHPMPRAGEKVVCLKNQHDLGILNGTQWIVLEDVEWEAGAEDFFMRIVADTGGLELGLPVDASIFLNEANKPQWGKAEQFTYGYALTCHKAQGSEFGDVVGFVDWPRNSESFYRWLYTLVTRAAEKLTLVL